MKERLMAVYEVDSPVSALDDSTDRAEVDPWGAAQWLASATPVIPVIPGFIFITQPS